MMRFTLAVLALLAPGIAAAKDATCDQLWTAFESMPGTKADRPEGVSDGAYRYLAGAEAYGKAVETVVDSDAAAFAALDKTSQMTTSIGLTFGDGLMTCNVEAALADAATAELAQAKEAEHAPDQRAEIVARFRLQE